VDLSVIIVNWNRKDLLLNCLSSVFKNISGLSFEVIVVDNGSDDGSPSAVREKYPEVILIENRENLGFAKANNIAFRIMKGRYALLLNNDCILKKGSVEALYRFMEENPDVGICCGQLLNPDGSKQNSFSSFPNLLFYLTNESLMKILFPKRFPSKYIDYRSPIEVDSCIGACMMIRKEALDSVGYFDEDYFFFFEETDLAYRMKKKGWKVFFVPSAQIYHLQGKTVGSGSGARILFYRSRYTFLKKHYPERYWIYKAVIFSRVFFNMILNLFGLAFTFGMKESIKEKFIRYKDLFIWHLKGCP